MPQDPYAAFSSPVNDPYAAFSSPVGPTIDANPDAPNRYPVQNRKVATPPSLLDRAIGAGETVLSVVSGIPAQVAGASRAFGAQAANIVHGQANSDLGQARVRQAEQRGTQPFQYQPRTAEGQRQTGIAGDFANNYLMPVAGLGNELGVIMSGARGAQRVNALTRPPARVKSPDDPTQLVDPAVAKQQEGAAAAEAATRAETYARNRLGVSLDRLPKAFQDTLTSVARDATTLEGLDPVQVQREARLASLKIPYTRANVTRNRADITREENIKNSDVGQPIRDIEAAQDTALHENLAAMRGAGPQTRQGVGTAVQSALDTKLADIQAKKRLLYERAQEAGAMAEPVDVTLLDEWMTDPTNKRNSAYLQSALNDYRPGPHARISINDMEKIRQEVSANAAQPGPPGHYAKQALGVIDQILDDAGNPTSPYRAARAAHRAEKAEFDRQGRIKALVSTKGKTTDQAVATENVLDYVMGGSAADIAKVRTSLLRSKNPQVRAQGVEAWKAVRAGVIDALKEKAAGRRMIPGEQNQAQFNSSFLDLFNEWDKDGKLAEVFHPIELRKLRKLRDAVEDVRTKPAGRISGSDTTPRLIAMLERFGKHLPIGDIGRGAVRQVVKLKKEGAEAADAEKVLRSPLQDAAKPRK